MQALLIAKQRLILQTTVNTDIANSNTGDGKVGHGSLWCIFVVHSDLNDPVLPLQITVTCLEAR